MTVRATSLNMGYVSVTEQDRFELFPRDHPLLRKTQTNDWYVIDYTKSFMHREYWLMVFLWTWRQNSKAWLC